MDYLEFAKSLALRCGKIIRNGYHSEFTVEKKGELDFVTRIDRESEQLVLDEVAKAYPDHSVIGEEFGTRKRKGDFTWVVDPLDGTTNFVHHIPYFCVSIALREKEKTLLGVVYSPMTEEMFYAEKGKGAFLNGKPLKIAKQKPLEKWFLAYCFRDSRKHEEAERIVFDAFYYHTARTLKLGSAALELCYAASNRVDAYIGLDLKEWDYAAGELIVTEAGGAVRHENLVGKETLIAGEESAVALICSRILQHNDYHDKHHTS